MENTQVLVTVLGSGTAVQFEQRASASYLIEAAGKRLLVDAGFLVVDRLERAGVRIDTIDTIFLSHKHPDHVMGLFHILFALRNPLYQRKEPLTVFGFPGMTAYIDSFRQILGRWGEPACGVIYLEPKTALFAPFTCTTFPVQHTEESVGLRVDVLNRTVVYTGDAGDWSGLFGVSSNADLFIADSGSGSDNPLEGHLNAGQIREIAVKSKVRNVLCSHIYPGSDGIASLNTGDSPILFRARDLLQIRL